MSIIFKNIASDTDNVSPSKKESSNEPILENSTDHIGSENEIAHEHLDVKVKQALT